MAENKGYPEDTPAGQTRRLLQELMNLYPDPYGKAGPHVSYNSRGGNYIVEFPKWSKTDDGSHEPRSYALSQFPQVQQQLASLEGVTLTEEVEPGERTVYFILKPQGPIDDVLRKAIAARQFTLKWAGKRMGMSQHMGLRTSLAALAMRFLGPDVGTLKASEGSHGEIILDYPDAWVDNVHAIGELVRALDGEGLIDRPDPNKALKTDHMDGFERPDLPLTVGLNLMLELDDKNQSPRLIFTLPQGKAVEEVISKLNEAIARAGPHKREAPPDEPEWAEKARRGVGEPLAEIMRGHKVRIKKGEPLQNYLEARFGETLGKNIIVAYDREHEQYRINTGMKMSELLEYLEKLPDTLLKRHKELIKVLILRMKAPSF